mmetsp:Transcript_9879/g.24627  ORF Transcript_9879/g.24627 Transcript_9879/m.24627 type:complete len:225 (+) Transcript_9879:392-1066(+)
MFHGKIALFAGYGNIHGHGFSAMADKPSLVPCRVVSNVLSNQRGGKFQLFLPGSFVVYRHQNPLPIGPSMVVFGILVYNICNIVQFLFQERTSPMCFQESSPVVPYLIVFGVGSTQGSRQIQILLDRSFFGGQTQELQALPSKVPNRIVGRIEFQAGCRQFQRPFAALLCRPYGTHVIVGQCKGRRIVNGANAIGAIVLRNGCQIRKDLGYVRRRQHACARHGE